MSSSKYFLDPAPLRGPGDCCWSSFNSTAVCIQAGVEPLAVAQLRDHEIQRLAAQGMGILLISNDIPELLALCSGILLMHRGCIVERIPAQAAPGEIDLYSRMEQLA